MNVGTTRFAAVAALIVTTTINLRNRAEGIRPKAQRLLSNTGLVDSPRRHVSTALGVWLQVLTAFRSA